MLAGRSRWPARRRRARRPRPSGRGREDQRVDGGSLSGAAFDELDAVLVGILHEAEAVPSGAHRIRRPLGLDSLLLQPRERPVEVVDRERDVTVARAEVVRSPVVVVRELEFLVLAGHAEEVVRRLLRAVTDDVELAPELETE